MAQNVYLISLGCDKNRIDAEIMAGLLEQGGFSLCGDVAGADCAVINTCGFIEGAKQEAIENIFDMVREKQNPAARLRAVVVTGCLAQRYQQQVAELIPELDAVIGLGYNHDIAETVRKALAGETTLAFCAPELLKIEGRRKVSTPRHYAYLKIAEGCSNHCAYCAIPSIRGKYRSRPQQAILEEARQLRAAGVKELLLVAQDTTLYGRDLAPGSSLAELLDALAELDFWKIKILYAYPEKIDDRLLDTMARHPNIARYLDMPLQHCEQAVLKRMGRNGSRPELLALVNKIREKLPGIVLRTTFIVGFPGESEQQFESLLDFAKQAQFERAGCFAFSAEEGTPAERLPEQLSEQVKASRANVFMRYQSGVLADDRARQIGRTLEVICDSYDAESNRYICRSEYDIPEVDTVIYLQSAKPVAPGDVLRVTVTGADACDLFAEV